MAGHLSSSSSPAKVAFVNPDLQKERDAASFKTRELTHLLDGGENGTIKRKRIENIVFNDPVLKKDGRYFLSQSELYEESVAKAVRLHEIRKQQGWTDSDYGLAMGIVPNVGFPLQFVAFVPSIERIATEEQKARWLQPAKDLKIIGCYAQTELGHGTNLRGLETTATLYPRTDEFIIHSPTVTSMKFWPGNAGKSANHALVLAQMIINGKNHGMQPFMVPLRSMTDHTLLPGVKTGSIGPVFGLPASDNGFISFDNVRIPRFNLLAKYTSVSNKGGVAKLGGALAGKANYASMTLIRVQLVKGCYVILAKACTVGVRYSAVRRQSELKPGAQEPQIIEFQTQQYKIFPYLAATYALFFAAKHLNQYYGKVQAQIKQGDFSGLANLHSISAGMKSFSTELGAEGTDIIRRSLGGHGYLLASGLCTLLADALGQVTAEGEATILYLQTARSLVKRLAEGNASGFMAYLMENLTTCPARTAAECSNHGYLVQAYKKRAQGVVQAVGQKMQSLIQSGLPYEDAWNQCTVNLVRAAKAHCALYVVSTFVDSLRSLDIDRSILKVLTSLCTLYALHNIITNAGEFFETQAITTSQMEMIRSEELKLLAVIRPDAVALVDSFDIHDKTHNSILGCYDGNVYEKLFEWAKQSPLNKTQVQPAYYKYMRPFLTSKV